jgi:hypothetical protein
MGGKLVTMLKTIAFKLYRTAQVLVVVGVVGTALVVGVIIAHDRHVAAADLKCWDAVKPPPPGRLLNQTPEGTKCNVDVGALLSTRAWVDGHRDATFDDEKSVVVAAVVIAFVLELLLFVVYRWVRWLARPEPAP